ncbi:Teichoic acid translocation permease protein TagG [Eubacterium plexicaudatum ASF492]|uniref:Transport permease protein n=1 Tax=Eubacterium plexicaudatum ASF492 TaxID=1235802 RepID=N2BGI0_9FIRM|nr:Teichoic acid translocation permease protein TagG [Eubacterium plexicaudatum ASF492]
MNRLKELYAYREMIFSLVKRDLKGRYKGSALGFFWTFLNPLLQLAVYTMVFSTIMRSGIEDYYLFLFVALIPWIFFSTSLTGGASCIMAQQDMVKKIYFPREVLPVAYVTSQFVNMLLSFIVIFIVLFFSGHFLQPAAVLCLPLIMIIEYILALGFTMVMSAVTVYIRDLEYILGIFTMAWQFLTPVMYPIEQVPEQIRIVFSFNPMTYIITAYRDILYYGKMPRLETLLSAVIIGSIMLVTGWTVFFRLQKRFVEEI